MTTQATLDSQLTGVETLVNVLSSWGGRCISHFYLHKKTKRCPLNNTQCTPQSQKTRICTHTHTHTHTAALFCWGWTTIDTPPITAVLPLNTPYIVHPPTSTTGYLPKMTLYHPWRRLQMFCGGECKCFACPNNNVSVDIKYSYCCIVAIKLRWPQLYQPLFSWKVSSTLYILYLQRTTANTERGHLTIVLIQN